MCGPESFPAFSLDYLNESITHDNNNNIEIFIKRKPLVYTRARRAVQKKRKKKKSRTVQQQ